MQFLTRLVQLVAYSVLVVLAVAVVCLVIAWLWYVIRAIIYNFMDWWVQDTTGAFKNFVKKLFPPKVKRSARQKNKIL